VREGKYSGPRIFACGPVIDGDAPMWPEFLPGSWAVSNAAEARAAPAITSPRPNRPADACDCDAREASRSRSSPRVWPLSNGPDRVSAEYATARLMRLSQRADGYRTAITCGWIVMQDGELAQEGAWPTVAGVQAAPDPEFDLTPDFRRFQRTGSPALTLTTRSW
jgi:hypothetical protein